MVRVTALRGADCGEVDRGEALTDCGEANCGKADGVTTKPPEGTAVLSGGGEVDGKAWLL